MEIQLICYKCDFFFIFKFAGIHKSSNILADDSDGFYSQRSLGSTVNS